MNPRTTPRPVFLGGDRLPHRKAVCIQGRLVIAAWAVIAITAWSLL